MKIQVEKNVPMPEKSRKSKYPWTDMAVGDSFAVGGDVDVASVRQAVYHAQRRGHGQFQVARTATGCRVWRTA